MSAWVEGTKFSKSIEKGGNLARFVDA